MTDPFLSPDDDARRLARDLLDTCRVAALGTLDESGAPFVTRTAMCRDAEGQPLIFVSRLSLHTAALLRDARLSLLVSGPATKGDPLTQPRLTLQARALPVAADAAERPALRALWLAAHPKSALWIDFPDFLFFRLPVTSAFLNAGFAKAYKLSPPDLSGM